ncbi:hypothetical protein [Sphingobium yanoikuyae]|uniref:hypothetical protein n=1 Tax=Sphingobium yanoikuyae TaxID=13690 RepID=UPI0026F1282C|nr:hypothetical protein [Sphingobium yanoikuyae]
MAELDKKASALAVAAALLGDEGWAGFQGGANVQITPDLLLDFIMSGMLDGAANNDIIQRKAGAWINRTMAQLRADLKAPMILAQSGVAAAYTGGTAVHDFASFTLPGGLLGPNGSIEIESFWTSTNNANIKTFSVSLGAATALWSYQTSSTIASGLMAKIMNRNSQASQIIPRPTAASPYGVGGTAHGTSTIDTSVDQVVKISGQLANAADTLTLESYLVKVYPS